MTTADAILSDVHATYAVTMTNGSGIKELVLTGTQYTVWVWCCRAGETRGSDLAGYVPVDIRLARPTIAQTLAACTCPRWSENYSLSCPAHGL
jgi:hypothetical protein